MTGEIWSLRLGGASSLEVALSHGKRKSSTTLSLTGVHTHTARDRQQKGEANPRTDPANETRTGEPDRENERRKAIKELLASVEIVKDESTS
jgi:hypothetical protein